MEIIIIKKKKRKTVKKHTRTRVVSRVTIIIIIIIIPWQSSSVCRLVIGTISYYIYILYFKDRRCCVYYTLLPLLEPAAANRTNTVGAKERLRAAVRRVLVLVRSVFGFWIPFQGRVIWKQKKNNKVLLEP